MKIYFLKIVLSFLLLHVVGVVRSQVNTLSEGFNATALPADWSTQNLSNPTSAFPWRPSTSAALAGFQNEGYILVNFASTTGAGEISNWLFSPVLNLKDGAKLTFFTRTGASDEVFPDRMEVRVSTNSTSTNAGTTSTSVGDFTNVICSVNPTLSNSSTSTGGCENPYPLSWTQYFVTVSGVGSTPVSGRIAFRYFVPDGGQNGANSNIIGLDELTYDINGGGPDCSPVDPPYTMPISTLTPPALPACAIGQNVNGDQRAWRSGAGTTEPPGFTSPFIFYQFTSENAANDWLFTRGLNLVGGSSYTLSFKYNNDGSVPADGDDYYPEKLKVMYGNGANAANMNTLLADYPTVANATAQTATITFTPASSGVYYIGFQAYSDADMDILLLDDISVIEGSLPVTLTHFTGERQGIKNVLKWFTASEQNNKGFELERSADGVNFTSLGFTNTKAANGNSASSLAYLFDDVKPFKGSSYYRLKQVDKDGKFKLSSVVMIKGLKAVKLELGSLYPNPTKAMLNMVITAPSNDKINLLVTDLAGKLVMQQSAQMVSGDNNLQLNVAKLPAGSYMIKAVCTNGCETAVSKFVKQ